MSKFLRLNMKAKTVVFEDTKDDYALFGGRGLIAKILTDEVDPKCDALGAENKLIVCPGLFTGTTAPSSGRLSIGAKSPLTGTIKEANAGGTVSQMLAKLDIKAIIFEDKPEDDEWFILKVSKEGADLIPAGKYVGMGNYELAEELHKEYGEKIGIASIGGAGELGYRNSTIQISDPDGHPTRAAARGGLGSVMGSKGIKAVVLDVTGPSNSKYADKDRFLNAAKDYSKKLQENPLTEAFRAVGTAANLEVMNEIGGLPTRNFSSGKFEKVEDIGSMKIVQLQAQRGGKMGHRCHAGCVIGCSNVYHDENGEYLTASLEYETLALNGPNCGISSLDTLAKIDRMCDDFGIDTIETGCTIAVCMEGGIIEFGDEPGAINLIEQMIQGTDFGKVLGNGTEFTGKKLGVKRIPVVKGQAMAAYDPRAIRGNGIVYAVSTMGADHTTGNTSIIPPDVQNQDVIFEIAFQYQVLNAIFDALGMCGFAASPLIEPQNIGLIIEMMAGKVGGDWDPDKLFGIGVQTLMLERAFNRGAGFTNNDDRLPEFMSKEPLPPFNTVFNITGEQLDKFMPF